MPTTTVKAAVAALLATLAVSACPSDPASPAAPQSGDDASAGKLELNQALHDQLPDEVKQSKRVVAVNTGSFPPYTIVGSQGAQLQGATGDIATALEQLLGITIEHKTIDGLASVLAGMDAGRYDLDLGPVGDFPDRQQQATFVDWVQEHVVFAVKKGNPEKIVDLDTTCGKRVAVQAAGSAEEVIKKQAAKCTADGKPAVQVQSYKDQPSSILAVQSNRADAFFSSQAPLTYFVKESGGKLELSGVGKPNGFNDLYQGAMVPQDSPMADVLVKAFEELHRNGTYDRVMDKWGLQANKLDKPGINMGID